MVASDGALRNELITIISPFLQYHTQRNIPMTEVVDDYRDREDDENDEGDDEGI